MQLNLNADLGESFGAWKMGEDDALLGIVDSANIACGFHAGDPLVMRRTVRAALAAGTSLGAHPAFPDLQGFGRRVMHMAPDELEAAIIYQLGALTAMATAEGERLSHVKPHGALNNMACEDATMAATVARAVKAFDAGLILLAPVLSELARAGEQAGLAVALEVFADRAYTERATLVPRSQAGAVLHESSDCIAHVQRMIEAGGVVTVSGKVLKTPFHSICVHGDNAHAVGTARQLRSSLEAGGHTLLPLPALFGRTVRTRP